MSKTPNTLHEMRQVLENFVSENKLQNGLDTVEIRSIWEQVMGPAIVKYTQDIELKNHSLFVALRSSVLREELSYGKERIIHNLNEALGKDLIQKLILR